MTRPDRIPDPRQKICYWVGQTHSFSFIPRSLAAARTSENAYYSFQFSVVSFQYFPSRFVSIAMLWLLHEQLTTET
jgi:hypothetical protein